MELALLMTPKAAMKTIHTKENLNKFGIYKNQKFYSASELLVVKINTLAFKALCFLGYQRENRYYIPSRNDMMPHSWQNFHFISQAYAR